MYLYFHFLSVFTDLIELAEYCMMLLIFLSRWFPVNHWFKYCVICLKMWVFYYWKTWRVSHFDLNVTLVLCETFAGEFMQLGSKELENERFSHYLKKTYKKTASLVANTCKAVSFPFVWLLKEFVQLQNLYELQRNISTHSHWNCSNCVILKLFSIKRIWIYNINIDSDVKILLHWWGNVM